MYVKLLLLQPACTSTSVPSHVWLKYRWMWRSATNPIQSKINCNSLSTPPPPKKKRTCDSWCRSMYSCLRKTYNHRRPFNAGGVLEYHTLGTPYRITQLPMHKIGHPSCCIFASQGSDQLLSTPGEPLLAKMSCCCGSFTAKAEHL